MNNPALGACLVAVLAASGAACGGGGKPQLLDSSVDALFACDPIKQTGCKMTEKCTWIVDIDGTATMEEIGHVGCVAVDSASATQDGAACADATAMANGGADTCVAGDLCISGKCKPICDPQVTGNAAVGACMTNFACSTYAGVFVSGVNAIAGVCDPACDPLTQQLKAGTTNIDACGSADPTKPTASCVFGPDAATWICAPTGPGLYGNTDRKPPLTNPAGKPYPNGCAPGFVPLFFDDGSGAMKVDCTGTCAPLKTDIDIVMSDITHAKDNQGDTKALAKLTTEAAPQAGNAVCAPDKKGSVVSSTFGEDCRFSWWVLFGPDPTMVDPSPYNDTVGFCFAYEKFNVPMSNPAVPEKSCAELQPPAKADPKDPSTNAAMRGCYPTSAARAALQQTPIPKARSSAPMFRLTSGPVPLVRHIFD